MKSTPCSGATQGGSRKMMAAEALKSTDDTVSVPRLKTSVRLAGVARKVSAEELLAGVRQAAEAVADFSWLSRGDMVLIKRSRRFEEQIGRKNPRASMEMKRPLLIYIPAGPMCSVYN
ncbi:MAG: hypothetical protein WBR24_04735 [Desulfobacterales bacterium]|jgi:hypothetical protein